MLAVERRKLILEQLHEEKHVVVSELSRRFSVSEETIRRDLERFEKEELVTKSYGGAVLKESVGTEVPFKIRKKRNVLGKRVIGEIIADSIADGDHILLDPSTTALFVVKMLRSAGKKNITIITNSVEVLMECAEYNDWEVISTGGNMQAEKFALTGPRAIAGIKEFHADKAIISCRGIDMKKGLTDTNIMFSQVKQTMLDNAAERILAVNSSKFDQVCFSRICDLSGVDTVVTDKIPTEAWMTYLSDKGVKCIYGEQDQSYSICQ
ncbi:MAG: DeoR/GlpR family DNA-binding transcription regulator [Clostridiales bacterium]|nr:DeoR/GlpR family DNA-binding transcription regulator [Clostridiales bacterium]